MVSDEEEGEGLCVLAPPAGGTSEAASSPTFSSPDAQLYVRLLVPGLPGNQRSSWLVAPDILTTNIKAPHPPGDQSKRGGVGTPPGPSSVQSDIFY